MVIAAQIFVALVIAIAGVRGVAQIGADRRWSSSGAALLIGLHVALVIVYALALDVGGFWGAS